MKKSQIVLTALLAASMFAGVSFAEVIDPQLIKTPDASQEYVLDGKTITVGAQEGLVPLRVFTETLGYTVLWQADTQSIVLKKASTQDKILTDKDLKGGKLTDGRWYVPVEFFESVIENTVIVRTDGKVVIESSRYAPEEASTLGEVVEVTQGKDGIQMLIKGQKFGRGGYDEISLAVNLTVPVVGGKLEELKARDYVYVRYNPAVTKSLPPLGQAEYVEMIKEENLVMGKILEVVKGNTLEEARIRVVGTSDYLLGFSKESVVMDASGEPTTVDALKEGMVVKIYTAPYATMSIPPQTEAFRVFIQ